MKVFRNDTNQIRSGWKIGIVFSSFYITTLMISLIFTILYYEIIMVNNSEFLSDQINNIHYIQEQLSGMTHFPAVFLHLMQCVVMIFFIVLFWKLLDGRKLKDIGFTNIKSSSKDLCIGLLIGAISFTIVAIVLLTTKSVELANGFNEPKFSGVLIIQLIIFILVGINEELFRGYCMTVLKQTKKSWIPIIVSSVIFALMHSMNAGISLLAYTNLFLFGISMAYLFMKTENLWMCIGYHITWNYFQGDVFGFLVSGNVTDSIYTINTISPNIINGGSFGPEGGLVVTILLVITIFIIYRFLPSRKV